MRIITSKSEVRANGVKALFQNPRHHYTFVILHNNGFLYFYDEKLSSCVAVSKGPLSHNIKFMSFCSDYGEFVAYFDGTSNSTSTPSPYITVYQIDGQNKMSSTRYYLKEKPSNSYLAMAMLTIKQEEQEREALILMQGSKYRILTLNGEQFHDKNISIEGRQINAAKVYTLKEGRFATFLLVQHKNIIKGHVQSAKSSFTEAFQAEEPIQEVFLDSAIHKKYMGVLTKSSKLMIVTLGPICKLCYTLAPPGFSITNLCFFYPGINSSPNNHLKDRVFLVFQGTPVSLPSNPEKDPMRLIDKNPSPPFLKATNICIQQFQQSFIGGTHEILRLKPKSQSFLEGTGKLKTILLNQHELNCIRGIDESHQLISYSLSELYGHPKVDEEWIYLAYNFRNCDGECTAYEEQEGEFENELWRHKNREVSQEELDDWSQSCLGHEDILRLRKNRSRCLSNFDDFFQ